MKKFDYIVVGSGVIGLTIAWTLKKRDPNASILVFDKENEEAFHASSRNSGVLHAGFYYSSDSLKAKLTVAGNAAMKAFCRQKNIKMYECGKLVVAQNEDELKTLYELEKRGKANGSNIALVNVGQARSIEPNVKTHKMALYSPDTASVNPKQVCQAIKEDLVNAGVSFSFNTKYLGHKGNVVRTSKGDFEGEKFINCAGLYADKVAHDFGFGKKYTMIPFKGLYLLYTKNTTDVKINIYPVPNLKNPFLGVHFTKTVDGTIKIGPTAIPSLWRENYAGLDRFKLDEFTSILWEEARLFMNNSFGFRDLAFEESRKYNKGYFVKLAQNLVQQIDPEGFTKWTKPGIRAQLLDVQTRQLVQDFVIEGDKNSIHVLNAVSPAFTCAFPFSEYVINHFLTTRG